MCGILGIIENNKKIDRNLFNRMLLEIKHRGPESEGVWFNEQENVAFGHRRLAIIDLSPGGHQPMISDDGRYVITFNGEIYNYKELKKELEKLGKVFKTQSDTEVLLSAYIHWGAKCLDKLNGMFAFGIWDNKEQQLFAARDRLGEKPFKYHADGNKFIFASEIKAILADRSVERKVDWQSIDTALSFRFVGAPETGFVNIKKLPAGHYLIWKNGNIEINKYWNVENILVDDRKNESEWKERIWSLFLDSVRGRMVSDVSVGAFLSGGIDSTSVIAAMKELGIKEINSFVISMGGKSEDQKYAGIAAKYFGTNHHEIELGKIDYEKALGKLTSHYDEPFFDQSALPSMLISEQMKKYSTVVLSGDGGDELFGGYEAYRVVKGLNIMSKASDSSVFKVLSKAAGLVSKSIRYKLEISSRDLASAYSEYYALWKTSLPISKRYITKTDLYLPEFKNKVDLKRSANLMKIWLGNNLQDLPNSAMLADINGRLADGYLTKVDIAAMASAIEVRPPFLDHRLVEMSRQIPGSLKIKNGGKHIWKEIVKGKLPADIIARKKTGFSIPLHNIIKEELRDLVEGNILSENSRISEIFSTETIKKLWSDHLNSKADYSNHLWSLLTLELWLKKYLEN